MKLFLDDERNPPDSSWAVATSSADAKYFVICHGVPEIMSLDHDLGGDDTSINFLRWLADNYVNQIPKYVVHSQNPVGRDNIISFMESWKKSLL